MMVGSNVVMSTAIAEVCLAHRPKAQNKSCKIFFYPAFRNSLPLQFWPLLHGPSSQGRSASIM